MANEKVEQYVHPSAATFHNCPPSFWRRCLRCDAQVRAQDVRMGRHVVLRAKGTAWCGPVSEDVETTGGTWRPGKEPNG